MPFQRVRPWRERPPRPRAWYGLGVGCVFTPRPPPSKGVAPYPLILPGRVSRRSGDRRLGSSLGPDGGRVGAVTPGYQAVLRYAVLFHGHGLGWFGAVDRGAGRRGGRCLGRATRCFIALAGKVPLGAGQNATGQVPSCV